MISEYVYDLRGVGILAVIPPASEVELVKEQ